MFKFDLDCERNGKYPSCYVKVTFKREVFFEPDFFFLFFQIEI